MVSKELESNKLGITISRAELSSAGLNSQLHSQQVRAASEAVHIILGSCKWAFVPAFVEVI